MKITDLKEEVIAVIPNVEGNFSSIVTERYEAYILAQYTILATTMGGNISVSAECDYLHFIKREPKTFLRKLKLIILDEISRQRSCF